MIHRLRISCSTALKWGLENGREALHNYELKALTQGSDAKGEVNIRLSERGQIFHGTGVDTDVIVASCRAYIDALNKVLAAHSVRS